MTEKDYLQKKLSEDMSVARDIAKASLELSILEDEIVRAVKNIFVDCNKKLLDKLPLSITNTEAFIKNLNIEKRR